MLKILSREFENALNSGDKSVSNAYKKLREECFPDWRTMGELELEHKALYPKLTDNEWFEVFPEVKPYLKQRFRLLKKQHKELAKEILNAFIKIYSKLWPDEFSKWFWLEVVKTLKGEKLDELKKEIEKLKFLLYPPKEGDSRITDEQILHAKNYPIANLIKTGRGGMAICPFHPDKNPSFNTKKNFGYCHACGWSGDSIKVAMQLYNLTFPEAVRKLS